MPVEINTNLEVPSKNYSGIKRILILGIGNILMKDEGIGVHIVHQLQEQDLPDNVEVIDGGTAGLDILLSQEGLYKLVVIDAIRGGKEPGTIYKAQLKAGETDKLTQIFSRETESKISLHQVGLLEALSAAEKMNCAPEEVTIIGVEPEEIHLGLELSELAKRSIPEVIEQVLEEIQDVIHRK